VSSPFRWSGEPYASGDGKFGKKRYNYIKIIKSIKAYCTYFCIVVLYIQLKTVFTQIKVHLRLGLSGPS